MSGGDVSAQLLFYASGTNSKLIRRLKTIHHIPVLHIYLILSVVCVCAVGIEKYNTDDWTRNHFQTLVVFEP